MTPAETNIVKSLIAVAWADGQMTASEASVVEGIIIGFDASSQEEKTMLKWAKTPRTLEADVPVSEMSMAERHLLLSNAALLTMADGTQTSEEVEVLQELIALLEIPAADAQDIIEGSVAGPGL